MIHHFTTQISATVDSTAAYCVVRMAFAKLPGRADGPAAAREVPCWLGAIPSFPRCIDLECASFVSLALPLFMTSLSPRRGAVQRPLLVWGR